MKIQKFIYRFLLHNDNYIKFKEHSDIYIISYLNFFNIKYLKFDNFNNINIQIKVKLKCIVI